MKKYLLPDGCRSYKANMHCHSTVSDGKFTPQQLKGYPQRALGHAGDQPKFIPRGQLTPDWHFSNNMVAAASLYSNAEDLAAYARYHVSTTHNRLLDSVFAEVRDTDIQRPDGVQGIAWTTDFIGLEKITYQVGYIGGYSSFIGYDKERGNAVVVLQNTFNWSNYIGIALLMDMAKKDGLITSGNRFANNRMPERVYQQ